jgi:cytochrome c biogenesis protein CcdA
VILIESPGCNKCIAAERAVSSVMAEHKDMQLVSYKYFSAEGKQIIRKYRAKDVPSIIIGNKVINYRDYEGDDKKLDRLIRVALWNQTNYRSAQDIVGNNQSDNNGTNQSSIGDGPELNLKVLSLYSISAVLMAGLVAGFNPCLLGILVFLAASVLSTNGRRRELVMMVAFFSLGIFTMYFLFGLGMQRLLLEEAVAAVFRYVLTIFLVVIGLVHVLDAVRLNSGNQSLFRTDWALKYFQAGVSSKRLSSYFLIGALFSLVKAPCVGAIYLAILDLLSARSYLEGTVYLLFFNLGVILPIIVLGGFIALGMSPEKVDAFRKDHRVGMRLITGLSLLALAPLIYFQLI